MELGEQSGDAIKFIVDFYTEKIKPHSGYVAFFSILIASGLYIFLNTPSVNIEGSPLSFYLPNFQDCEIEFKTPVLISGYYMLDLSKPKVVGEETNWPVISTNIGYKVSALPLHNFFNAKSLATVSGGFKYRCVVSFRENDGCDVKAVSIDGKPVPLSNFYSQNLTSKATFQKYRYIRDDWSSLLTSLNDFVSNIILTALTCGILILLYRLIKLEFLLNCPAGCFLRSLRNKKRLTRSAIFDAYSIEWYRRNNNFKFLQALGPALGFILTVSSLITALHPTVGQEKDLKDFIAGIHVAMVSTFLGLLLRLLAMEAARVNDRLLERSAFLLKQLQ